jgi:hypothetical protein
MVCATMRTIVLTFALSLLIAAPALAVAPGVERERHRIVIPPGSAATVASSVVGAKDYVEIGIRKRGGGWLPYKMFRSRALVWWTPRFTASAFESDTKRIKASVVNTSRRTVRLKVIFDIERAASVDARREAR